MSARAPRGDDSGFSLIEVLVSMLLLAIMAMAFLPLVARATSTTATQSRVATATRLVGERMEAVRSKPNTICDDRGGTVVATLPDPRGGAFQVHTDITGDCPGNGIVQYVVWAGHSDQPTVHIAEATTSLAMDGS
jgi:prepilin-type N-terminal cleavage/methylation domain-containing protein